MLFGEPQHTAYDLHFTLFGIPVRVHPMFWLVALLLGHRLRDVASVLTWVAAVFIAILVHELGHAFTMRAYGYHPWITLYGMGGQAAYGQPQGFRSGGPGPVGEILICLAGPAAGFILAAVLFSALLLAGHGEGIGLVGFGQWEFIPVVFDFPYPRLAMFLNHLFFICVLWGLVNLMPVYPLDGGQIAREVFLVFNPREGISQSLMLSIFVALLMAVYGFVQWQSIFMALLFGYLAYASYAALQAYSGRGPW